MVPSIVGRSFFIPCVWAVLLLVGCATPSTPAPGVPGGNAGGAALTAVAAGAVWAAGGGCRLQGCPYGTYCDQKSGLCEVKKCSEGCPEATVCNEGLDRCQAAPPAQAPNDFLPQDNRITTPPGMR